MWVVKLGGSLASFPGLRDWLAVLARGGGGRVVIVPGGGRFADAVRQAQREWRFDDAAAHRMALLAMDQYGHMLAALESLEPADSESAIAAVLDRGAVPVWLPHRMCAADPHLDAGWNVTSDSLSLWLARRLAADALVLVKSAPLEPGTRSLDELVAAGAVDRAFTKQHRGYRGILAWMVRSQWRCMGAALERGAIPSEYVIT